MNNWKKKIQNFSDIQTLIILPTVDTHLRFRPSKLVSSYFSDALLIWVFTFCFPQLLH